MIRVCDNNHNTGFRHCWCGSDVVVPLGNRQQPKEQVRVCGGEGDPRPARPSFVTIVAAMEAGEEENG